MKKYGFTFIFLVAFIYYTGVLLTSCGPSAEEKAAYAQEIANNPGKLVKVKVIFNSGHIDTLDFQIRGTLGLSDENLVDDLSTNCCDSNILAYKVSAFSVLNKE